MALTTRRTGSAEYGRYIKALIVGEPGSGKTLISSTFPNPYFVSAEGGLMSIADRGLPYIDLTATEDLLELRQYLELPAAAREAALGVPVDTVVIDTIDEVQRIAQRERLTKERRDQMTLQDWGWLSEKMQTIIRSYRNLPIHVVLTCHIKETRDDELGRIVYKPGLQGAIADQIAGYVDLSLLLTSHLKTAVVNNATRQVLKRELQTFPDVQHPWIKDRSGKLPTTFEVNFQDDFARLEQTIFGAKALPTNVPIVASAPVAVVQEESKPEETPQVVEETPAVAATAEISTAASAFKCEDCGTNFDDSDQAELSHLRRRKTLCSPCYKASKNK